MLRWCFIGLALLQLVPVWAPAYFPTTDGPSHVYNAVVIRELLQHHDGPIADTFELDLRPHPNVLGHVALVLLLAVFRVAVAEKILVSAIVLLFLLGAWLLAEGRVYAFLAFPFVFHELLQYGFYNYCLSAAIYLITLALWWRWRDRTDWRTIAIGALLILLCYTAHPSSTLLLIGSIGVLWLTTRRHVRQLAAFVPVLPLLGWYFLHQPGDVGKRPPVLERLRLLGRCEILWTFDKAQLALGTALMALLIALIAVTLVVERRRRDENGFAILTLIVGALYLAVPDAAAGGLWVSERLALIVPLLPLPWLTPRLPRWARTGLVAALALVAAGNAIYLTTRERAIGRRVDAFVRAERAIPEKTIVLALNGEQFTGGARLPLLAHASGYVAAERRQADLDNYEAFTGYFPVKLRRGRPVIDRATVEMNPSRFDATMFSVAGYVFVWHLPDDVPRGLAPHYELVERSSEARVYRRREGGRAAYQLLLPIAGTTHPIDGPSERWNVEQTIANRGSHPFEVHLSACAGGPCDFVLEPGASRRIASEPDHPFLVAGVPLSSAHDVIVRTIVERDGNDGAHAVMAVPAMPLESFAKRTLDIPCVPLLGRVRLRLWIIGPAPPRFDLIALREGGGPELKRVTLDRPADGYVSGDLTRLLAPLRGGCVHLRVEAGDGAVWGFVSETGRGDAADALYLPRTAEP